MENKKLQEDEIKKEIVKKNRSYTRYKIFKINKNICI